MADQHVFLSDGWLDAARVVYESHDVNVTYKIRMNQVITDCPFEPGEVKMYLDTSTGKMDTGKGELENPEVTLTTDWETSRKILIDQDQAAAMQAFMSGKIKVTGDMTKIMMMNANPPTEAQKAAAADIKSLTA